MFGFDPVLMLEDDNDLHWAVRVAAYNVIGADRKAAADHQKQHARVTGSTPRRRH